MGQELSIFVTGVTGFSGSHLVHSLLDDGHRVTGLVHPETSHQPLPDHDSFYPVPGDLLDASSLLRAMRDSQPEVVYHLAGQASPSQSWKNPNLTLAVNAGGTVNILEAARKSGKPRLVVITSAQIYENSTDLVLPITEETIPHPSNPYGVSKWAAGQLVSLYWQRYGLPVIEARPFNHIGPKQSLGFVVPDFASQIASIRLELSEPVISVGNLSAERDFTDVRDVVSAYRSLAERGKAGESYLICSGEAVSIQNVLDILIDLAGLDVKIKMDPSRMRPSDQDRIVGSFSKIKQHTGWNPKIPLVKSLQDTLDEWLERLSDE